MSFKNISSLFTTTILSWYRALYFIHSDYNFTNINYVFSYCKHYLILNINHLILDDTFEDI